MVSERSDETDRSGRYRYEHAGIYRRSGESAASHL